MKKQKKNKPEVLNEEDDDRTIAEMNIEGMPWYKSPEEEKNGREIDDLHLSKEESRAMIKGAYAALMPAFLIGLAVFSAAFGLIMLYFYLVQH